MKIIIITATQFIHRDIRSLISCDPMFFLRALLVQHMQMKASLTNGKSELTEKSTKNTNKFTSPSLYTLDLSKSSLSFKSFFFWFNETPFFITFNSENTIIKIFELNLFLNVAVLL